MGSIETIVIVLAALAVFCGGGSLASIKALAGRRQHAAIDKRSSELEALLRRVQVADQAYPQLPQELRDDIDRAVEVGRPAKRAELPATPDV